MAYEPGDPVRVLFPFEVEGKEIICEGTVLTVMGDGYYRVELDPPTDVGDCLIERAIVHERHFV